MITRDNHTISGYSCTHRYFNDRLRTNFSRSDFISRKRAYASKNGLTAEQFRNQVVFKVLYLSCTWQDIIQAAFYGHILEIDVLPVTLFESRGTVDKNGENVSFLSTGHFENWARGPESRQKTGWMPLFCLPNSPNPERATLKVEQNLKNLKKYSTQLPSPKTVWSQITGKS